MKVAKIDPRKIVNVSKEEIKIISNAEGIKTYSPPMSAREFAVAMASRKMKSVKLAAEKKAKAKH